MNFIKCTIVFLYSFPENENQTLEGFLWDKVPGVLEKLPTLGCSNFVQLKGVCVVFSCDKAETVL